MPGEMQIGALTAFLTYLVQILMSVMMATFLLMHRAARRSLRRADPARCWTPTPRWCRRRIRSPTLRRPPAVVSFDDTEFTYPGADSPVLRNISFTARAGPDDGDHRLDRCRQVHADLADPAAVRRHRRVSHGGRGRGARHAIPSCSGAGSGWYRRRPFLFSGTVASNLRYGNPDATDEELWHALRVAQAEDFVREMPGQLEAPISQGGTNVSGGQRQRLSIARALVKRPEIYVFDDSFSALDVATDARLRAALQAGDRRRLR